MGQKVYDPSVNPNGLISIEEARAGTTDKTTDQTIQETFGLELPAGRWVQGAEGSGGPEDILKAFPQLAGIIASFTPVGRTYKGAAAVPAIVESVMQAIRGEGFDPGAVMSQGAMGVAGKGVGAGITRVGNAGTGMVRRALGLSGDFKNRAAEEMLPKLAIRENAKMTIPGVDKIASKAQATGAGGLEDLASVLEEARINASTSPNFNSGGLLSMITHLVDPPKQLAIGKAMAEPLGVNTANTIAPTAETAFRALLAYLSSQLSGETPERPSGPRRRSQP